METDLGAIQFDTACLWLGRHVEKEIEAGREPFRGKPKKQEFVDPRRAKRARRIKIKEDGTW
jgi:hypothetical protein